MSIFKSLKLVIVSLLFLPGIFLLTKTSTAAAANHIVISEIQIGGLTTTDEFVELYNPTNNSIDLTGWRLQKKSSSGATVVNLVASMSGIISAHGHFLVTHPNYTGTTTSDLLYSGTTPNSIASDNTVVLYSDAGTTVVDKVGMGTAVDFEGAATIVPETSKSIERVILEQDTNNNLNDFVLRSIPNPQNTSFVESTPTPTASTTPTPTPTPTLEPTPTETPVPTETPTPTPSPTIVPTESPTPTPIETTTPTPTPTNNPTPTNSPAPSPTFSPTPTPSSVQLGWLKSPVFTCTNTKVPSFVYSLLKLLMPWKFNCGEL